MSIPRVFHRVWVGHEPMPEEFVRFGETWARHHPGWEMRLWTEDNLPELRRREILEPHRMPAERADILRYEVVWRYGGVYVDTDMECLRPIDELIEGLDFFTAEQKPGRIALGIFGAAPGHPLLDRAIAEARFVHYERPGEEEARYDKYGTGTLAFQSVITDFPDAKVFPAHLFYPGDDVDGAYAKHYAARSWMSFDPEQRARRILEAEVAKWKERFERAEKRRVRAEVRLERVTAERDEARRALNRHAGWLLATTVRAGAVGAARRLGVRRGWRGALRAARRVGLRRHLRARRTAR